MTPLTILFLGLIPLQYLQETERSILKHGKNNLSVLFYGTYCPYKTRINLETTCTLWWISCISLTDRSLHIIYGNLPNRFVGWHVRQVTFIYTPTDRRFACEDRINIPLFVGIRLQKRIKFFNRGYSPVIVSCKFFLIHLFYMFLCRIVGFFFRRSLLFPHQSCSSIRYSPISMVNIRINNGDPLYALLTSRFSSVICIGSSARLKMNT